MAHAVFDYDWIIVGSGFGGSVAALRLAEKGYRVAVLETGRRYRDEDFAETTWNARGTYWAPALGLVGPTRLSLFKDIFIASGVGVGGGSLVYANTLYRAKRSFFEHPQWAGLGDWAQALKPHYDTAERMLGVQTVPFDSDGQQLLRQVGRHFGAEDTFSRTPCAVFFGTPGVSVPDPYFSGSGPARTGCTRCGSCTLGCRVGAKNSLVKNYLWFAERVGVTIIPETEVRDIQPLDGVAGASGYSVHTRRSTAWLGGAGQTFRARGVVVAAGALGTNQLLARCKLRGGLPNLSLRLGQMVRTNSESILAVTLPDDRLQTSKDVAISASIHVSHDTHIEFVNYGRRGDSVRYLYTLLTDDGTRLTRPLKLLEQMLRHPRRALKSLWPIHWSRRTLTLLVMQSLDNAIAFVAKPGLFGGVRLSTRQDPDKPNPTFIREGFEAAKWLAAHTGGLAQSMLPEALANIPTTAHILGGAVAGRDAASGVVDREGRVFGYRNLIICDGSILPANPGVNPSLTITALAEYIMTTVPNAKIARTTVEPQMNPSSEPIANVLADTLALQRRAYRDAPVPDLEARRNDLRTLQRFVRDHTDAICDAISADYGHRSRHETLLAEVMPVVDGVKDMLKHLARWMKPQRRSVDRLVFGLASNRVIPQPVGVVGVIVPWNFPLNLSLVPLTAIFAAGNRAMVKMSENSRHLARLLIERMPAYFPPDKLQFFDETGGVGIEFSKLPFDHLIFTGSGTTGRAVMAAAAQNLCPVTLELGGKAPAVVCDDFPLRTAAERILYVKYLNAGQICTTVDHVFVPRDKVEAFAKLAAEIVPRRYARLDSPDYTSVIDQRAFDRLIGALEDASRHGARVVNLLDGPAHDRASRKIAPHIVLDAPWDCELMQREIFGPILPIVAYDSLDEVIARINSGPRPLALYPFSHDRRRIEHMLDHVMSGGVSVNDALFHVGQHDLPFGGIGESGMGHYHGREGFETFSKLRPVFHQARASGVSLLYPPYGRLADRMLSFLIR